MRSKLVGKETDQQHSIRLVNNLVQLLAQMSFCGDTQTMVYQLEFHAGDVSISFHAGDVCISDRDFQLDALLLKVRDYVVTSHNAIERAVKRGEKLKDCIPFLETAGVVTTKS